MSWIQRGTCQEKAIEKVLGKGLYLDIATLEDVGISFGLATVIVMLKNLKKKKKASK